MKQPIQDAHIKDCVRIYQRGVIDRYHEILKVLSPYIYNYPRVVFGSDSDRCGDFYEYVLRRLKKILKGYRQTDAKFLTWFAVVLRHRYLNFIRERKLNHGRGGGFALISLDYRNMKDQSLYNLIADCRDFVHSRHEAYDDLIERIVHELIPRQRVYFLLYFIEALRPDDALFLSVSLSRSIKETLSGLNRLKDSIVHRYKRRQDKLDKLNLLFRQILQSQEEQDAGSTRHLKEKRDRMVVEYRRIKLHPSYESIAVFLEVPLGTVSTGIARMKRAVGAILEDLYHEKLPL
jgi:RNA polymerase sigma factor (sigma-70 family)